MLNLLTYMCPPCLHVVGAADDRAALRDELESLAQLLGRSNSGEREFINLGFPAPTKVSGVGSRIL